MKKLITAPSTFVAHPQGYRIRFPLPEPRGFRRLRRVHVTALTREISDALNRGYKVRDPLNGKPVQIYRHSIFRAQVRTLERLRDLTRETGGTYIHVKHFAGGRRDGAFAKLALWGLIKSQSDAKLHDREACDGKWMITERGVNFLDGTLRVPRRVAVLLGVRLDYVDTTDLVGVNDITDDFDKEAHLAGGKVPA
jgi:hypothetical protein